MAHAAARTQEKTFRVQLGTAAIVRTAFADALGEVREGSGLTVIRGLMSQLDINVGHGRTTVRMRMDVDDDGGRSSDGHVDDGDAVDLPR